MNQFSGTKASSADQLFHQAFVAHNAGKLQEAEAGYRKALRKAPSDMETLYLLGTACSQQGKFADAEKFLKKALEIAPHHPEALNNMGLTLRGQRKTEQAIEYYRRALAVRPDYADAHSNLASSLEVSGQLDEAEKHCKLALQFNPYLANAHYTLGLVMNGRDRFEEAAECFWRGLQYKPDFSAAYNDLGGIYKTWGRLEKALECFDRALELTPEAFNTHNNRGAVYEEMERFEEALAEYKAASLLNPDDLAAKWNCAFLYLRQGILDLGWEAHEIRLKNGIVLPRFPYPDWDGSSLEGKTILISAEQGLGDEIFFASCIPDVIAQAKHCVIECEIRLVPLFARSFPTATIHGGNRLDINWIVGLPGIDVHVAAGSLPRYLRPTLASFPEKPAYLYADPQRVEYWRSRISVLGPELKVGICWRSGLRTGERHKQYSDLTQWGKIFSVPGVRFINLQYDECSEELRQAEQEFGVAVTVFPELNMKQELDETCALISSLDLVITAATAVSEMAGALGVPTFRIDVYGKPMDALGTGRSPWHPTTRLFGQLSRGDWDTPLALVAEALQEKASGQAKAVETVMLRSGVEIAVNGSLDDSVTYILKEQLGWFDAEYEFVLDLAQPGMRIVDVGAGIGMYAVPLAAGLSDKGEVYALTKTTAETDLLLKSRLRNLHNLHNQRSGLDKRLSVMIAEQSLSLDAEMNRHGLDEIGFVRLAHQVCHLDLFKKAERFFLINSPLLMFEIQSGCFDIEISKWLAAHDYDLYRLVPGLNLLVPLSSSNELDVFSNNLFACKAQRADMLASQGKLVRQPYSLKNLPGADAGHWQEYLSSMPYAVSKLETWINTPQKQKDWEVYWMALNLYAMAQSGKHAAERYACLQMASGVLTTLVQEQANLSRLLSLSRVLADLGKREAAVGLLNQICSLLNSGTPAELTEPCLALNDTFAAVNPGERMNEWTVAMILAQRENLRAFSDFFTGQEALPVLQEIRALGFGGDEIERRIGLIQRRYAAA